MYRTYDRVMCLSLSVLDYKEGYVETAVFVSPRQPVFPRTSLFLFQAAYSPFLGTKALLFTSSLFLCLWSYTRLHRLTVSVPIP